MFNRVCGRGEWNALCKRAGYCRLLDEMAGSGHSVAGSSVEAGRDGSEASVYPPRHSQSVIRVPGLEFGRCLAIVKSYSPIGR
jgi:hypothetical protein